jgi:hypothetical protein
MMARMSAKGRSQGISAARRQFEKVFERMVN